jgi:hypothetical protein
MTNIDLVAIVMMMVMVMIFVISSFFFKEIYCTGSLARYTRLQNCSFNQFAIVVIRRSW